MLVDREILPEDAAVLLLAENGFALLDWLVVGGYLALVIAIGMLVGRKKTQGDDYFLAGRSMPMWAVAISVLATSQSAATFVGGPQQAYAGNLTYFLANLGGLIAVVIVAVLFIPAFYRHRVTSIYELLGHRFGSVSQRCAAAMFLLGRIFASGARLFIVAIPFSLVAFSDISPTSLFISIALIALGATAYTLTGGLRAVIWTDVLQAVIYIATIITALVLLWQKLPIGAGEIIEALRTDAEGDKLTMFDTNMSFGNPYSIWAIVFGLTLFNLAAYGTDQDLTQRMLTCKSSAKGSWSVIVSNLIGWPIVLLFLVMGLLLHIFYQRPDLMAGDAPVYAIDDSRRVFLEFILHEMPTGLRGLMMAGLFAAAMSSMDSALNAMASSTIADFYRPIILRRHSTCCSECDYDLTGNTSGTCPECGFAIPLMTQEALKRISLNRELRVSRIAVAGWAVALAGFACFCVYWQQASGDTLINFALGVMVFAYAGLLAVFLTALLTNRGNVVSVIAALITGFLAVLLMQGWCWGMWAPRIGIDFTLAFPWKMLVATSLSFIVCVMGKRKLLT